MAAALVWNLPRIIADLPLKPVAAVLAIVWAIHVWTTFQAESRPATVQVTDGEVRGGAYLPVSDSIYSHVNWFGLTVESTLDEPYNADYAICAFRGPVIYSQQYGLLLPRSDADFGIMLGERQILVSMVAASKTSFFVSRDNYPNIGPGSRSFPHDKKMIYLSTTQTDAMTTDDKMVWCRAGPDLHKLVDDLHLTLDDHGVILGDRITWISGGGIPATNLMQRPSQEAQEAVEEALR